MGWKHYGIPSLPPPAHGGASGPLFFFYMENVLATFFPKRGGSKSNFSTPARWHRLADCPPSYINETAPSGVWGGFAPQKKVRGGL